MSIRLNFRVIRMKKVLYHFGSYSIDIPARQLWRVDQLLSVSAVMFDLIAYLLQHRERAVGRDELISAVWGSAEVSDSVFAKTLFKCRRVLGDSGDEQCVIRTVPRFGFHWIAPVRLEFPDDEAPAALASVSAPGRSDRSHDSGILFHGWRALALLAVVFPLLLSGSSQPYSDFTKTIDGWASPESIPANAGQMAVLPVHVEAEPEDAWLRFGVMDMIAGRLREAGAHVVTSEMVVRLMAEDGSIDTATLQSVTGAQRLVTVSLRRADGDWTLSLSLDGDAAIRHSLAVQNADPLMAGKHAADALLARLGLVPRDDPIALAEDPDLTRVLQRIQAALLIGNVAEARRWWTALSDEQQQLPESRLRRGFIEYRAGDIETAYQSFSALAGDLDRIEPGGDAFHGRVLAALARSATILNKTSEAEAAINHAIELFETSGNSLDLGRAYIGRASLLASQGRYLEGSGDISRARATLHSSGDAYQLAMVDYLDVLFQGRIARTLEVPAALDSLAERFEHMGALVESAHLLSNRVLIEVNLLRCHDALHSSDRAYALLDQVQNSRTRHIVQYARAIALYCTGQTTDADILLSRLDSEIPAAHQDELLAMLRSQRAEIERVSGRPGNARLLAQWVRDHALVPDYAPVRAAGWYELVRADLESGVVAQALDESEALLRWAETSGEPAAEVYAYLALARSVAANGSDNEAQAWYERAWRKIEDTGLPVERVLVADAYGQALLDAGDADRAIEVIGKVGRFAEQDYHAALLQARLHHFLGDQDAWRRALKHARSLAGERRIPPDLEQAIAPASPVAH